LTQKNAFVMSREAQMPAKTSEEAVHHTFVEPVVMNAIPGWHPACCKEDQKVYCAKQISIVIVSWLSFLFVIVSSFSIL
jgi:hypothetical protein